MVSTTGARQTRSGGRSARVRSAVMAAAAEELAVTGYPGYSCEAVAERAGVHRTTIYRRWGTRENLILDVMLQRAHDQAPIPDTGSLVTDLIAHGMTILANVRAPEVEATIRAIAANGQRDRTVAAACDHFWGSRFAHSSEMVDRAVARGEVPPDTDPALVIEALTGPIYFRLLMTGQEIDERFVERLARLVAAGVGG